MTINEKRRALKETVDGIRELIQRAGDAMDGDPPNLHWARLYVAGAAELVSDAAKIRATSTTEAA